MVFLSEKFGDAIAKLRVIKYFFLSLYKFPNVINQSREGSGPVGRELTTIYNGVISECSES